MSEPLTPDRQAIENLVFDAVGEVNRQLRAEQRLEPSLATPLSAEGGGLDSLGILNLLVLAEQRIGAAWGLDVLLADDDALSREPSPFRTLGSLADHIEHVLAREMKT